MSKRVVTTALCVIPPKEIWEPIQEIRQKYDKAYERWMPHINIVYPFVETKDFDEVEKLLTGPLSKLPPFKVKFEKFESFEKKDHHLFWLKPFGNEFQELFKVINEIYPGERKEFTPHLTVGQFPKDEKKKWSENLNKIWKPVEWELQEVYLISRDGKDDPFKVRKVIHLKGIEKSRFELVPIEKKENVTDIFVRGIGDLKEEDLEKAFSKYNVVKINVNPKGFAFIKLKSQEDQKKAIEEMNGKEILNKKFSVAPSN